jgi:hypothetical protein
MKSPSFCLLLLSLLPVNAVPVVDPGIVKVPLGTTTVQVPVLISGGDAITDMAGLAEVGSPPAGGPTITAVSYTGSIWNNAPGGYVSFFTDAPPAATVGPNVSLRVAGQSVSANGLLLTLTVNIAGRPAGDYPVRFSNTQGGSTQLANGINLVPATYAAGVIRIVSGFEAWQLTEFASSVANSTLESTVWGALADPDMDGQVNLLEYYTGTNPNVASRSIATPLSPGCPTFSITTISGQRYATLSYTRRKTPGDVSGDVRATANLLAWTTPSMVDVAAPVNLSGGTLEYVVRRLPTPISPATPSQFLRLRVAR